MALRKIVSGGQTGVDRAALDAALDAGFPCGGWCPQGRRAEDGVIPARYPLEVLPGAGYAQRTLRNVEDSDATLIIHEGPLRGGTALTAGMCRRHRRPLLCIDAQCVPISDAFAQVCDWLCAHQVSVLNVAGPRRSQSSAAGAYAGELLKRILSPSPDPARAEG